MAERTQHTDDNLIAAGMQGTGGNPRVVGIQWTNVNLMSETMRSHQQPSTKTQQTGENLRAVGVRRTKSNPRAETIRSYT